MFIEDAFAELKRGLGFRTGTGLDSAILSELNKQMRALERSPVHPWFLLSEFSQTLTVIGEQRVQLPTDYLFEYENGFLYRYDATMTDDPWTELEKDDEDFLRENQLGSGPPLFYAQSGVYFILFQVPDAVYTLRMKYWQKDADIVNTAAFTNKWLTYAPNLLVAEAGYVLASDLQNQAAIARFDGEKTRYAGILQMESEERDHTNRRYVMGGDD